MSALTMHSLSLPGNAAHFDFCNSSPLCDKLMEGTGLRRADFEELGRSGEADGVKRIYIVENEIVYLTFPLADDIMCIFGGGFAVSNLASAAWMGEKDLYYFGDEDEHGFEILALFRFSFLSVKSFLMDTKTYLDHISYAVRGRKAASVDSLLTPAEMETLTINSFPNNRTIETAV